MSEYTYWITWLLVGLGLYMTFVGLCVYAVLKMAHDEEPGCLNPRH